MLHLQDDPLLYCAYMRLNSGTLVDKHSPAKIRRLPNREPWHQTYTESEFVLINLHVFKTQADPTTIAIGHLVRTT